MDSRRRLSIASIAAVAFAVAAPIGPVAAKTRPAPGALAECANAKLPPSILAGPFAGSAHPLPTIRVPGAKVPLELAVATDEPARELGLMCVTRLAPARGMIFVFAAPAVQEFWMKNTLIPLDMVWVDASGVVTSVAAHVPASTRDTPDDAIARRRGSGLYVIELGDGQAAVLGIATGIKLGIPYLHATE